MTESTITIVLISDSVQTITVTEVSLLVLSSSESLSSMSLMTRGSCSSPL